jgi:hypothetical protein
MVWQFEYRSKAEWSSPNSVSQRTKWMGGLDCNSVAKK